MLLRKKGITLQYQIEGSLRTELETLSYGEKIPSEDKLAELYGVSRGTIRQVIIELVNQGLLHRIHGKGTFKGGIAVYNSGFRITSFTEQLIRCGFTPGIKDIKISTELPNNKIYMILAIGDYEPVWKISRIRLANDSPISFSTAYLRKDLIPQLVSTDLEMSLIDMITKKYRIRLMKTEHYCSAILANNFLSEKLSIEVGSPILHVEHVAYGLEGRPVFLDISESIGNKCIQRF